MFCKLSTTFEMSFSEMGGAVLPLLIIHTKLTNIDLISKDFLTLQFLCNYNS